MKDEPVAWMRPDTLECGYGGNVDWEDTGCIPLYTHPVKELTDEEIDTIVRDFFGEVDSFYDFRLVIRRCIRKAQEK